MGANPILNVEAVTGCRQSALVDLWSTTGFAAAISDVTSPHVYDYGELADTSVAVTLYDVRRHVLIEDGRVRRDGRVRAGQFRIGQPGRTVVVDAVPDVSSGKLLLLYLGKSLLSEVGASVGDDAPIELMDKAWDVDDPFLSLSASRLVEASELNSLGSSLLAEQLAYTLALHLSNRYALPRKRMLTAEAEWAPNALGRMTEYVRANSSRNLTLAEMAKVAGTSPSSLIRSFKKSFGSTPHRFVIEQRVRAAQDLLAATEMPIAEIALAAGFASQSHLGMQFRSVAGMTPGEFRRRRRGL